MDHPSADDLLLSPLLASLDEGERERLASWFETEEFSAGRRIVSEQATGYAFYVIAEGEVSVAHGDEELTRLGPGDFFGEMAILGEGRRTATVTAIGPVVAWVLFGTRFRSLQSEHPEIAGALTAAVEERKQRG